MPKSKVNPAAFNRRVTIQKRTVLERSGGDNETVWYNEDSFDVWAAVTPLKGREYIAAGAVSSPDIITARTWYRVNINAQENRLLFSGKVYNIENVTDLDAGRIEMELTCTEEVGAVAAIDRS